MKIAVIGYSSQNFFNPIAKKLKSKGLGVDLFSLANRKSDEETSINYSQTFYSSGFNYINLFKSLPYILNKSFWAHFKKSKNIKSSIKYLILMRTFKDIRKYQTVNIQQVNVPIELLPLICPSQKLVLSFWGSDLLKSEKAQVDEQNKWVQRADIVTMQNEEMLKVFRDKFDVNKDKVRLCLFPLDKNTFQKIDEAQSSNVKINIAVGYNLNPSFRHLEVISLLTALPRELKGKINIVLFATYGGLPSYLSDIKGALFNSGISYTIYDKKVSTEIYAQRIARVDMLVQSAKSDAFSATVSEVLYNNKLMLAGDWLPYDSYKSNGVYFRGFSNFESLKSNLKLCIESFDSEKEKCLNNKEKVKSIIDIEGNVQKWVNIFEYLKE